MSWFTDLRDKVVSGIVNGEPAPPTSNPPAATITPVSGGVMSSINESPWFWPGVFVLGFIGLIYFVGKKG